MAMDLCNGCNIESLEFMKSFLCWWICFVLFVFIGLVVLWLRFPVEIKSAGKHFVCCYKLFGWFIARLVSFSGGNENIEWKKTLYMSGRSLAFDYYPSGTRRCFNVYTTSITLGRRRMNAKTTLCAFDYQRRGYQKIECYYINQSINHGYIS